MTIYVALDRVRSNPWQPRTVIDEARIGALAADILSYLESRRETLGLLQLPAGRIADDSGRAVSVTARPDEILRGGDITAWLRDAGAFVQLAYGHTRLAAFHHLVQQHPEYALLPIAIVDFSDEAMATAAWSENERRKDLTPLEQAVAVERYMQDFGWTQQQAAEKLHLDRSTVANKLRLLKLPEAQREQMQRGELSERQALALLPLVELPKSLVKKVEGDSYGWMKPSKILKEAASKSSDQIRRDVDSMIEQNSQALANVNFVDHPFEGKGFVSPTCSACPSRLKRGNQYRCLDPGCFAKKADGWEDLRLAAAAAATGIQAVDRQPPYNEREVFYSDQTLAAQIVKAGCERLRLIYGTGGSQHPPDFPDIAIVCHHEAGKGCACLRRLKAKATRNDPARIEERERKKAVQRDYIEPADAAVLAALRADNLGVWRKLLRGVDYQIGNKGAEMTLEQIQAAVAHALVKNALGYQANEYPDRAKRDLETLFTDLGLVAPWSDPLADVRVKFERIQGWMQELTTVCPTVEALRGNITNLNRLADEVADLPKHPTHDDASLLLMEQIVEALETLEELLPIVEQHGQLTLVVMTLVHDIVTGDEPTAEAVIDKLEFIPAYHYALALLPDTPAMHGRIAHLLDRLAVLEVDASVCAQTGEEVYETTHAA